MNANNNILENIITIISGNIFKIMDINEIIININTIYNSGIINFLNLSAPFSNDLKKDEIFFVFANKILLIVLK